mmetsp:Transcript_65/g.134  ORF Transcript_65/g.134 Transcript_65/m.134 type:complete len:239 (-) Transcript_65:3176-3892(-)
MLGLLHRLAPFKQFVGFDDDPPKTGVEVLDLTLSCEAKLNKLLDCVNTVLHNQYPKRDSMEIKEDSVGGISTDGSTSSSKPEKTNKPQFSIGTKDPTDTEPLHINNIRVRPRRAFGNGELGTPLSSARSDSSTSNGAQQLMPGIPNDVANEVLEGVLQSPDDSDEECDAVYDAYSLKKAAKARVHKAIEERKAEQRREKTLTGLKDKKQAKLKRLAKPNKHQQKKQTKNAIFERPELV